MHTTGTSHTMGIAELLRAINNIAETGATPGQYEKIAHEIDNLADMTGWARGIIDPHGAWLERLAHLQSRIEQRYEQTRETGLLLINDRLSQLGQSIARHDADLDTTDDSGDSNVID